jgi:hypothetical protein
MTASLESAVTATLGEEVIEDDDAVGPPSTVPTRGIMTTALPNRLIARLDALAKERGLTRDEVVDQVVRTGLDVEEGNLRRLLETKPSPGSTAQ